MSVKHQLQKTLSKLFKTVTCIHACMCSVYDVCLGKEEERLDSILLVGWVGIPEILFMASGPNSRDLNVDLGCAHAFYLASQEAQKILRRPAHHPCRHAS
jgi:hypothetical protein